MPSMIYEFLDRVRLCTDKDVRVGKDVWHMLAAMNSELGEFTKDLRVEEKVPGHEDKTTEEGTLGEGVDVVICALALYFIRGGTISHLFQYGNVKLDKWERGIRKAMEKAGIPPESGA